MAEVPMFAIVPRLSCCTRVKSFSGPICGELPQWQVQSPVDAIPLFYCTAHKPENATPIGDVVTIRRIRLTVSVLLTATSRDVPESYRDAYSLVQGKLIRAGGAVDLVEASSTVGRGHAPDLGPALPVKAVRPLAPGVKL